MTREEIGARELEVWLQGRRAKLERVYQQHSFGPPIYQRVEDYELKHLIPGTWLYGPKGEVLGIASAGGVVRRKDGEPIHSERFYVYAGRVQVKACDCEDCTEYRELFQSQPTEGTA